MNKIDVFVREDHHRDHAMAIYNKLPEAIKGDLIVDKRYLKGLTAVFCYADLKVVNHKGLPSVFSDHGVGFYFNQSHPSYAGSIACRENIVLRLSPNETHAKKEREVLQCPVEVIGVPKLDEMFGKIRYSRKYKKKKIAFSFHWDTGVCWATRSAYRWYINNLEYLKNYYDVVGHGHPRIIDKLRPFYEKQGIKTIYNFEEIIKNYDVYVADATSTIFEFAFFDKPVVLLNCPLYDKDQEEPGCPRFWKHANIGPQVDRPEQLHEAIEQAIRDFDLVYKPRIQEMKKDVFGYTDGQCAQRACDAIIKHCFPEMVTGGIEERLLLKDCNNV